MVWFSYISAYIFEDSGVEDPIPLPNVNKKTLIKVLDYCKYHKKDVPPEIEKPLKSHNLADVVC